MTDDSTTIVFAFLFSMLGAAVVWLCHERDRLTNDVRRLRKDVEDMRTVMYCQHHDHQRLLRDFENHIADERWTIAEPVDDEGWLERGDLPPGCEGSSD
jgi:hypothetical protein